ncbi:MAG: DMT family transporter [Deltaproteobacteria bacterium]
MAYLSFLFICLVWGASFILMKKAGVWFSPAAIGAWRVIGGAAILGLVCWRSRIPWAIRRRDLPALAFVIVCGFAWPFCLQPWLVSRNGSAFVAMTVSFTPLITIAASIPLLGVYPARRQFFGVLGALGFMALLMLDGIERQIPLMDLALALTVPLCYAVTNTVIRRWLSHVPSLELSFVSLAAAGALLLPLSIVLPFERGSDAVTERALAISSLIFLGIVGTGITTYLFNRLIQHHGPLFAGMVTNLVPIGALLWGWADHERVTALQIVALAGLVSMVTVVQFGAARPSIVDDPK